MTWRDALLLVVTLAVPFAALYGLSRLSRWAAGRRDPIHALITKNAATPRPGMEKVDWPKVERAGERKWQDTIRGQRRTRRQQTPTTVVDIRSKRA